jgi:hypothetical protein
MTSNPRIERLTREALGPARRTACTERDENLLRAVGIVIAVLAVITLASWPRQDAGGEARPVAGGAHAAEMVHATHHPADAAPPRKADNTPIY